MTDPAISLFKKYPVLEKGQLIRFISPDPSKGKSRTSSLLRNKNIAQSGKYIQAYPWKPSVVEDEETLKAIWVMLAMCRDNLNSVLHGPDTYPFNIHFIVGDEMEYRILFVNETTPKLCLRIAERRKNKESFVLVTDNPKHLAGLEIPDDVPVCFVHYSRPDIWGLPRLSFYRDRRMTERISND